MNRPGGMLRGALSSMRQWFSSVAAQSERTILLGTVLLASAVSGAVGFVLAQYYSVDVLSSLMPYPPYDCWLDWGVQIGRHCFSDYAVMVDVGLRPNPWEPYPLFLPSDDYQWSHSVYPAAGTLPHVLFGAPAEWLGVPAVGLVLYLLALTIAVLAPAVWAARGARGLERIVVFVALGAAAVPAWAVVDRGNSAGFLVPVGLVFLVALSRQRWGRVALMVIVAALLKPQFAVLAVALFAARQWRMGGLTLGGVVISNLLAYLVWPRDFPETIVQSIRATLDYGGGAFQVVAGGFNVSFARGLLLIPDALTALNAGGQLPDGFLAGPRYLLGYLILVVAVGCVLALGRRIPPVMVGIVLLAVASLFPALSNLYYLVFVLPIAALVTRDPDGPPKSGIFDRLDVRGDRRRAVGVCVSLAVALSIAHIPLPIPPIQVPIAAQMGAVGIIGTTPIVPTTVILAPLLWLLACAVIIVSYARRPAPSSAADAETVESGGPDATAAPQQETEQPLSG